MGNIYYRGEILRLSTLRVRPEASSGQIPAIRHAKTRLLNVLNQPSLAERAWRLFLSSQVHPISFRQ
jgi:hypothetical protein